MMEGKQAVPSMQMYDTWREKRVQRFSTGVDRMRERLKSLQDQRDAVVEPESDWAPTGGKAGTGNTLKPSSLAAACRTIVYKLVDVAALTGELSAVSDTPLARDEWARRGGGSCFPGRAH